MASFKTDLYQHLLFLAVFLSISGKSVYFIFVGTEMSYVGTYVRMFRDVNVLDEGFHALNLKPCILNIIKCIFIHE